MKSERPVMHTILTSASRDFVLEKEATTLRLHIQFTLCNGQGIYRFFEWHSQLGIAVTELVLSTRI